MGHLSLWSVMLSLFLCMLWAEVQGVVSSHTVTPSLLYPVSPQGIEVRCVINMVTVYPGPPRFDWYLEDLILKDGRRVTVTSADELGIRFISTLALAETSWRDSGNISCKLTLDAQPFTGSTPIYVLGPPSVTVTPLTVTVTRDQGLNLTCNGTIPDTGHPLEGTAAFTWYRDDVVIGPNDDEIATNVSALSSTLHVPTLSRSVTYSCSAENEAGPSPRAECDVTVIAPKAPACDEEPMEGWTKTAGGVQAKRPCPSGTVGRVVRACTPNGTWSSPDDDYCVDKALKDILDEISGVLDGIGSSPEKTGELAGRLETTLGGNSTEAIKPGNLNASLVAILQLSRAHLNFTQPPTDTEVENIISSCSTLLATKNKASWEVLLEEDPKMATGIMGSVDRYADAYAKVFESMNGSRVFDAENVVLTSGLWEQTNGTLVYPDPSFLDEDTYDEVRILNGTLSGVAARLGREELVVSSTYYTTLKEILPTWSDRKASFDVGSRVLAISISNTTQADSLTLDPPLQLVFSRNKTLDESDYETCNFWDFSATNGGDWSSDGCKRVFKNDTITACHCDHMTNFAILVSGYRPKGIIGKILDIMSLVGNVLSVAGTVATLVVYAVLWSRLKLVLNGNMTRNIILVNLCAVLTAANVLFQSAVDKTAITWLCTTIAVLLHYLFLVVFGLMLVSSINLYWKVISFSRGIRIDTVRDTLLLLAVAWGCPALVVMVTLAVTQTEGYGNDDYCWISMEDGLLWSFTGPILLVIMINMAILLIVLVMSVRSKNFAGNAGQKKELAIIKSTLRSIIVLVPIMGTNWVFGLLAVGESTVAFQFIFVIMNSAQGVFIFIFHCVLDNSVRSAWKLSDRRRRESSTPTPKPASMNTNSSSVEPPSGVAGRDRKSKN